MAFRLHQQVLRRHTLHPTAIGDILLIADEQALVGLYLETQVKPEARYQGEYAAEGFDDARRWLDRYFEMRMVGPLPKLKLIGTPFQQEVWDQLRQIPLGSTCTYGQIARSIGRPQASRAVGRAIGDNPISILIPCHRVIGGSGALTGYAGGLENKRWLLEHEGTHGARLPLTTGG